MTGPGPAAVGIGRPEQAALQRRTLAVLVTSQVLGGAGLASGIAVGALLAEDLLGGPGFAGLATASLTVGSAGAAVPLSRLMARSGRRPGLVLGYLVGLVGAVAVVTAGALGSGMLLLVGLVAFGAGQTANLLARYAASDLATPETRGRALSTVLFATTAGAVAGPNLVEPTAAAAEAVGLPPLTGAFLLSALAYPAAALVLAALLRPDPLAVAGGLTSRAAAGSARAGLRTAYDVITRSPGARRGLLAMVVAQAVMVSVMTMTPVHMRDHGAALRLVGLVISVHILGMYGLAPLTGWLTDRAGRPRVIALSAVVLTASTTLAAATPGDRTVPLTAALFLLGVGWSLGLVAGSALLTESVPLVERTRVQGAADLVMGLSGGLGALGSGLVVAALGFQVLAAGAACVAGLVVLAVLRRAALA